MTSNQHGNQHAVQSRPAPPRAPRAFGVHFRGTILRNHHLIQHTLDDRCGLPHVLAESHHARESKQSHNNVPRLQ